jgi:hypothetical protein
MRASTFRKLAKQTVLSFAALLFSTGSPAIAAVTYKHLNSTNNVKVLLVQGQFETSDDPQLIAHELDTFPTKLVAFYSLGGAPSVAMKFGREIRGLGLTTLQIRSSVCLSSCLLAFIGGVERFAEPDSIVVQQSSFLASDGLGQSLLHDAASAALTIKPYLSEMAVTPELFDLTVSMQPNSTHALTDAEARQLLLVTVTSDTAQANNGTAVAVQTSMAASEAVETALGFFQQFNAVWSSPKDAALAFLKNSYADTLSYYGKQLSAGDVLSEKQVFADRWPIRIYAVRTGSAHASCSDSCSVFGIVDWYASSRVRQKSSSGAVNFVLVWNPTTGKILSETGKIIETDKNPAGPDRIVRRWIVDATNCSLSGESGTKDAAACQSQRVLESELRNAGWCRAGVGWQYCGAN